MNYDTFMYTYTLCDYCMQYVSYINGVIVQNSCNSKNENIDKSLTLFSNTMVDIHVRVRHCNKPTNGLLIYTLGRYVYIYRKCFE